jgi:protein arginine N-methyltransferase 1
MRLLQLHQSLLCDQTTQEAYREAIAQAVRGGKAVLDLGTGTGIHALFASQAGARVVYAVDQHEFIEVAKKICEANQGGDRIIFLHGPAAEVTLPEKVDVVVGHHGLSALMELLPMARERFLKSGGTIIPARIEIFGVPIESSAAWEKAVGYWEKPRLGMSFLAVRPYAVNNRHLWPIEPKEFLSEPASTGTIEFASLQNASFSGATEVTVKRRGLLHGLGMWIVQWLSPGICLSTAPPCGLPDDLWGNDFLPLDQPLPVEPGQQIALHIQTGTGGWGRIWKWVVEVRDAAGRTEKRFAHCSFDRQLLTRDMLRKQSPDHQPSLSDRGQAVRFVLESCDGLRPLRWIEQEVLMRFPKVFSTPGEAAGLVANIVSKYTR